jgi:hypothetical protein
VEQDRHVDNYSIPFFEVLKAWVLNKQIDGIPLSRPECNNSQDFRDAGDLLNSVAFYIIVKTSQNSTFDKAHYPHTIAAAKCLP